MKNKKILKVGEEGHLHELQKGQSAIVTGIHGNNLTVKRRLLDMGITKGVKLEVKKIAPFGDPIDLYLRGYELCVRRKDVEDIEVEVIA